MHMRTLLIAGTAAAAGCAGLGGPSPGDSFSYGVPSPPSAVYHVYDTMSINTVTPFGSIDVAGQGSVTIGLTFATDPGGVRVTGTVEAFEGFMSNPMTGGASAGMDDVSGALEVLISRRGVEELATFPVLSGPLAQLSSFPALGYILFPRLPGGDVDPGETWVDTVAASAEMETATMTGNTVSTYTLVGDTVVDGRSLMRIAVVNEVTSENILQQGGVSITQNLSGVASGFILWDPEKRLLAYAEYERDVAGTLTIPGTGTLDTTVTGPTRVRLGG